MYATMQIRCICTAATRLQASKMQLGRIFNKVMQSDRKKNNSRVQRKESPVDCLPKNIYDKRPEAATAAIRTHKSRRVTVLNKVFMKYITDLMATGEVASSLIGKGIEVSHVNVAPDFSVVNVYWFAGGKSQNANDDTESIEKILKVSAGHLQHELSQLRVIGLVPPINFIKNKQYASAREVEDLLTRVDFGEDYEPKAYIATVSSSKTPTLTTTLSADLKARISAVDDSSHSQLSDEELAYEIFVPEMRQDVMGFDHARVVKKVRSSVNESRAAERMHSTRCSSEPQGYTEAATLSNKQVAEYLSTQEQSKLFSDFLKKRTIEEKKKQRMLPLFQVKMQEENDWIERMKIEEQDEQQQDLVSIDETYRDQGDDVLERK